MALSDVIDQYVTAFGAMTGIERCYADPPEAMAEFPCAIVYASSGELSYFPGGYCEHVITLEIHHSRQVLPEAVGAAQVWPDRVLGVLVSGGAFGGYVQAVVWPVPYDALALGYGNETHYGMRFRIRTMTYNDAH